MHADMNKYLWLCVLYGFVSVIHYSFLFSLTINIGKKIHCALIVISTLLLPSELDYRERLHAPSTSDDDSDTRLRKKRREARLTRSRSDSDQEKELRKIAINRQRVSSELSEMESEADVRVEPSLQSSMTTDSSPGSSRPQSSRKRRPMSAKPGRLLEMKGAEVEDRQDSDLEMRRYQDHLRAVEEIPSESEGGSHVSHGSGSEEGSETRTDSESSETDTERNSSTQASNKDDQSSMSDGLLETAGYILYFRSHGSCIFCLYFC